MQASQIHRPVLIVKASDLCVQKGNAAAKIFTLLLLERGC
jgi:hypothetical protein